MRSGFLACALLVLASTAAPAAKFSAEHDATADFTRYRTVSWREGTPASISRAQDLIVSAIEDQLEERGLEIADADADLYVVSYALVDQHTLEDLADETRWEFWTGQRSVRATDLGVGTLVVDLVDAESEQVIWRGLVSGSVSGNVERNRNRIGKLVRKLFRRFPLGAE